MGEDGFFYLSKMAWMVTNPGIIFLALIVTGTISLWLGWQRLARRILTWTFVIGLMVATLPLGPLLLIPLENRLVPPNPMPVKVDGIIALGGVASPVVSRARGQVALGPAVERITELARLAHLYPDAKLLFTGGSGQILNQEIKEADVLGPVFKVLGIGGDRLILENSARNTAENATLSLARIQPQAGETWLLITSAFHMPRSVGVFRKVGWDVVPYPVDYIFAGHEWKQPSFDLTTGLQQVNLGLHEWLGLASYRLSGKTTALFPGP